MIKYLMCLLLIFSFVPEARSSSLKIAIGLALPPYIISDENRGMEYDVVEEILNSMGYELEPRYFPFARIIKSMDEKLVDGVMTINEQSGLDNVYYSDSHITYQNVAVTLEKNDITINSVHDLGGYSIIGFQNARLYLGEEFKEMADSNPEYREFAQQDNQVALLYMGRTEVYVGDINIFNYYSMVLDHVDTGAETRVHEIFPETQYKVAFHDEKLRDRFNQGLRALKQSGEYDRIIAGYTRQF